MKKKRVKIVVELSRYLVIYRETKIYYYMRHKIIQSELWGVREMNGTRSKKFMIGFNDSFSKI